MEIKAKGYAGGLDKDIATLKNPSHVMYDARNIRVLTDEGGSSMSIVNTEGNAPLSIINASDASDSYDRTGYVIMGFQNIRDDFIVFYANSDQSGYGIIDKLIWNGDGTYTRVELYKSTSQTTNLEFQPYQNLQIESAYEDPEVIRIYFTRETYSLRILNVGVEEGLDPKLEATYDDIRNSEPRDFDRVPFVNHSQPEFISYGSGSLLSGAYQYAYRLVNRAGVYSSISPASKVIYTSPTIAASSTRDLAGTDTAEAQNSGVSIQMSIDLSNINVDDFEEIEVFSLYYSAELDTPTIYIIEQSALSGTAYAFADESAEAKFGTLTYAEFVTNTFDFAAATLAVKDNILFAGNIREYNFDVDFDARAYRANDAGEIRVVNAGVEKVVTKVGTQPNIEYQIDGVPIPEDADVVNPANTDPSREYFFNTLAPGGNHGYNYRLGGEGPHVSYTFTYGIYDGTGPGVGFNAGVPGAGHLEIDRFDEPYILGRKKGFKRGEVYRFGIVFFSEKGVPSPVKWIGDIMIPEDWYTSFQTLTLSGKAYLLMPNFTVNTAGTEAEGYDYQIVYVAKDELTRNIVAEGILNQVGREETGGHRASYYNSTYWNWSANELAQAEGKTTFSQVSRDWPDSEYGGSGNHTGPWAIAHDCFSLGCPEHALGQFNYRSGLKMKLIGLMDVILAPGDDVRDESTLKTVPTVYSFDKEFITDIFDLVPTFASTTFTTLNRQDELSILFSNVNTKTGTVSTPSERNFYKAKNLTFSVEDPIPGGWFSGINPTTDPVRKYLQARVFRDIVPYNGDTYADRLLSQYVPASDVVKNSSVVTCDRGDTTISWFDYTSTYWPIDIPGSDGNAPQGDYLRGWVESMWFPVETYINCNLRHDQPYLKDGGNLKSDTNSTIYPYLIQEKGNPTGDLFLYDSVYHKTDTSRLFVPAPTDYKVQTREDTKVRWSEVKQQGEEIDNWAQFKVNNFKFAEAKFGPINRLIYFNNNILYFQDSGFGVMSVNPRAVITTTDGVETALGTGETLDRFDYISDQIGSQRNSDIVKSLQALYWLDRNKKQLYTFNGNLESLSALKGLSGYLRETITNDSHLRGIYDDDFKDVYLTILGRVYQETVQEVTYQETESQTYYEWQQVNTPVDSAPLVTISAATAVSETSYVEIDLDGTTKRFTAVDSSPTLGDEFLAGSDVDIVLTSLYDSINLYLVNQALDLLYTVQDNGTNVVVTSTRTGSAHNFNSTVFNDTEDASAPSATITATAIKEDSTITLTFTGTTVQFIAKDTPVGATQFQTSQVQATVLANIYNVITTWLSTNSNTDYTVTNTGTSVTIVANAGGALYNLDAAFFNNAGQSSDADAGGSVGEKEIVPTTTINSNNSWVVIDFSTAGGVDRLDLYKNGSVVAQSNCLESSNYGFPDLTSMAIDNYVVGRLSATGKDYKPAGARDQYRGAYSNGANYDYGDIVSDSGNFYTSKNMSNNNNPLTDFAWWQPEGPAGGFNSDDWAANTNYIDYTYKSAFTGTNSSIPQQTPIAGNTGINSGMIPTRYAEYIADGGEPSEDWLGTDGTNLGGGKRIKGGVISHYNNEDNAGFPVNGRGQRVWAQYNNGDTYRIVVMGAGTLTAYSLTYFVRITGLSDLNVTDTPSVVIPIPSDLAAVDTNSSTTIVSSYQPVEVTTNVTTTFKKNQLITTVTDFQNYIGDLSTETGTNITHKITGLYHNYRFSLYVEYNIGGAIFEVTSVDYANNRVYLNLLEGTPTLGATDLTEFLEFRSPFTVTYNEILQRFTSFHSFVPTLYAKGVRWFFSSPNDNTLYEHNNNDFGLFYGQYEDSTWEVILSSAIVNEYTNLAMFVKVHKDSELFENEAIYSIKAWNDVQESDEIVLYPRDEIRQFKDSEGTRLPNNGVSIPDHPYGELYNISKNANMIWRAPLPYIRQEPAVDLDAQPVEFRERILGPYVRLRFKIKNGDNKRYVVDDVQITERDVWH